MLLVQGVDRGEIRLAHADHMLGDEEADPDGLEPRDREELLGGQAALGVTQGAFGQRLKSIAGHPLSGADLACLTGAALTVHDRPEARPAVADHFDLVTRSSRCVRRSTTELT